MSTPISIIICGIMGEGKTYTITKILQKNKGRGIFLFDYGNDSSYDVLNLSNNLDDDRCRQTDMNEATFMDRAVNRYNTDIVFEEATVFMQGKAQRRVKELLVRSSPHHQNNRIFWIFHDISSITRDVIRKSQLMILFKTNDTPEDVIKKDRRLLKYFTAVKEMPKRNFVQIDLNRL